MKSNIFRAYDVRGIYPEEINTDVAKRVGNAVARYMKAPSASTSAVSSVPNGSGRVKKIVVGEDGRIGSPELRQAVIEGITSAGADAIYVGQCTTPLFYFSVKQTGADGGIMVTASHNPPNYNGLKITSAGGTPLGIDEGLLKVKELADNFAAFANEGKVVGNTKLKNQYIDFLIKNSGIEPGDIKKKLVVDSGNGMASMVINPLFDKLKTDYTPLNFEIDGKFPNRSPDPAHEGALDQLKKEVVEQKADLGIAFDGDADRLAVVDEKGDWIPAQFILALLWQIKPTKVVYDSRFSKAVREFIGSFGVRSMVGHTHIAKTMRNSNAELGGETSGHFFFKDMNYTESAALAALKLMHFIQESKKPLSELVKPLNKYFYSGEIATEMEDIKEAEEIIKALQEKYFDGKQDTFDGLTVEYPEWWFNVRPSNTEPLLRLVVEANTEGLMEEKKKELIQALSSF